MKDLMDLHTHTTASGHAYSTITEMTAAARDRGVELLGITEHAPKMPGSCGILYFSNFRVLPRERMGVSVLFGVELNIMDYDGSVDLPDELLEEMDLVIASLHTPCIHPGTVKENTQAYLNAMKNPYVNIIGHPDDKRYPVDYRAIVEEAKKRAILLEVNNSSLKPGSFRGDPVERYIEMLNLCREYEQPVVLDSDAHIDLSVGEHNYAVKLLEEINFPEELVVNTSVEKVKKYLNCYKNRI